MVALILALDLSMAVGTMNGLIFYANIVQARNRMFLPFEKQNFFTVFIQMLNTELSFDYSATSLAWVRMLKYGLSFNSQYTQ